MPHFLDKEVYDVELLSPDSNAIVYVAAIQPRQGLFEMIVVACEPL